MGRLPKKGIRSSTIIVSSQNNTASDMVEVIESSLSSSCIPFPHVRIQLDRATAEVRQQLADFCQNSQTCLQLLASQQHSSSSALSLQMAHGLRDECLSLQQQARERAAELRSLVATQHNDEKEYVESILSQPPWSTCHTGGSVAVGVVSDVHRAIRAMTTTTTTSHTNENNKTTWSAPKTFVRETHKYWVTAPHRLEEVLLACAGELPLLVYGRTYYACLLIWFSRTHSLTHSRFGACTGKDGALYDPHAILHAEDEIWDQFATPISSIYFDTIPSPQQQQSSSSSFRLYHERLRRTEGAQLLRVRWYGTTPPRGTQPLFVELKTHHEAWVCEDSTKERVSIQERHMEALLFSSPKTKNPSPWTLDEARAMAQAGDATLDRAAVDAAAHLLLRIRALVSASSSSGLLLRPCVRTCYSRVSFQSSHSNALRLTVDRNVRVYDESSAPAGAWCCCTPSSGTTTTTTPMAILPCAIFEVKLAGRSTPVAVEQLEWSGAIRSAHKFSKFLTGVSVLHTPQLRQLPYWAREPLFHSLYTTTTSSSSSTTAAAMVEQDDGYSQQNSSRKTARTEELQSADSLSSGIMEEEEPTNTDKVQPGFLQNRTLSLPSRFSFRPQRKGGYVLDADLDSHDSDLERGGKQGRRGSSMFRRYSSSLRDSSVHTKSIAPSKRARIEVSQCQQSSDVSLVELTSQTALIYPLQPKSYFAAERTYIQWISAALLLVTVASILNALSVDTTHMIERIMMVLAGMITIYALAIYFRRLYLLERALPYGYQDHAGPIVLTTAILLGILTLLYFSVYQHREALLQMVVPKIEVGKCMQHSFSGVSMLEFQPSDIVVDTARDIFLVPSITDIRSLSKEATNDSVRMLHTLVTVDHEDFEALTFHDDGTLYAVSEDPNNSILLAFRWSTPVGAFTHAMELVGRWKLKGVANTEGMVFLPEDPVHAKPQRLLISSDAKDPLMSNVHIFDIPAFLTLDEPELRAVSHWNSAFLARGFSSLTSTKIAAMTAFEGVVYILHDNVRVIRGWDIATGAMVSEWITPRVGGEFDKQWEGISLERIDPNTVALHMALDTPPQIWSFMLEETTTMNGADTASVWRLPDCAQGY